MRLLGGSLLRDGGGVEKGGVPDRSGASWRSWR